MYDRSAVKLPRSFKAHPVRRALTAIREGGMTDTALAEHLNIRQQNITKWRNFTEDNRDWLLPAETVPKLSKLSGIAPHEFRPDLWKKDWVF